MSPRRALPILVFALPVLVVGFVVLAPVGCASVLHPIAYREGVSAAEKDIAAGEPHLVFIGLPRHDAGPLDPATGLPRYTMGCEWSPAEDARMDGYNATTLAALREGRLDRYALKHKATTRAALVARFEADGGTSLAVGAPPVEAPGGRLVIEAAPRGIYGSTTPYLFVTDRETGQRNEMHWLNPGARILFDHDGTTLLLRDEQFREFVTFDLPRRMELQKFPDPGRGW